MIRAICFGASLLLGLGAVTAEEARRIRIATEGAFPPFNYLDNNTPEGFEIELGNALCAAMKASCTFVVQGWEDLIKGLVKSEYDAIMASMAITEKRKARIAFSKPYYRIPASFIGRKDAEIGATDPKALAGRTIGTTAHSEHARLLQERYPEAEVKVYAKFDEANLDLVAERLDLVLGDKIAMTRFLESKEGKLCCRFVGDAPADPAFYGPGIAVGLRKQDKELKERFDQAIDAVVQDGTYDRIRAKYFPFDIKG